MKLTNAQIRAARALLRWRASDLAEKSGVGASTIRRSELLDGECTMIAANKAAIIRAFEEAGIEIIFEDQSGGDGVRFRK